MKPAFHLSAIRSRPIVQFACLFLSTLALTGSVKSETWSDSTGKFQVEAEYVGVQGKSVILRLADGTTKNIPISKLSQASRDQAKQLYEAAKSSPVAAKDATPLSSAAATSSATKHDFAPEPPAVSPMPTFPDGMPLQETVDFVIEQLIAGHPEVFWAAVPPEIIDDIDSQEVRAELRVLVDRIGGGSETYIDLVMKVFELLFRQKNFIINSPLMLQMPPMLKTIVVQLYDPAVGTTYEVFNAADNFSSLGIDQGFGVWFAAYGPRIGGHLKVLAQNAPPGIIEVLKSKIEVDQTSPTEATLTILGENGVENGISMTTYKGRWFPKDLLESWKQHKGNLVEAMKKKDREQGEVISKEAWNQTNRTIAMVSGMVDQFVDPLLEANNQEEFDAAAMKVVMVIGMMQGNRAPGQGPANPAFGQ